MQAAFVDIGLERDAFLYVADVYLPRDRCRDAADTVDAGDPAIVAGVLQGEEEPDLGPSVQEDDTLSGEAPRSDYGAGPTIDALLKVGQELLVQVTKDPLPNKGARVTTQVTFPGGSWSFCRRSRMSECRARSRTRPSGFACASSSSRFRAATARNGAPAE